MKNKRKICFVLIAALSIMFISDVPIAASTATSKKITLNKKKVSLYIKQKYTLRLKGIKNKNVKWSSSNKKVATVKNGVVSAKKVGKCIITAIYAKGKYKCIIKVEKNMPDDMKPNTNITYPEYSTSSSTPSAEPTTLPATHGGIVTDNNFSTIDDFLNVVMEAQLDISNGNTLLLKITNNAGTDITMDNYFALEFFDNNQWISVDFKENSYFEEILLVVKNESKYIHRIDLERYFTGLTKGKYRISKQIRAANQGVIKAEFTIN